MALKCFNLEFRYQHYFLFTGNRCIISQIREMRLYFKELKHFGKQSEGTKCSCSISKDTSVLEIIVRKKCLTCVITAKTFENYYHSQRRLFPCNHVH